MYLFPVIAKSSPICQDHRLVSAIAKECVLSPSGRELVAVAGDAAGLIARMVERELWSDVLQILAQTLPHRSAVWWGCLCVWHASTKAAMDSAEKRALEAAGKWVLDPVDEHRRIAARLATFEAMKRPGGCLAAAIEHVVPGAAGRPEFVGHLVAAAVLTAAEDGAPQRPAEFVALALRIGNGEIGWPESKN